MYTKKIMLIPDYIDEIDKLKQKNQELKEKVKTYEDPEDLTLMFMYCDEKAKDKIRELRIQVSAIEETFLNQQKEFIEYLENKIKQQEGNGDWEYVYGAVLSKYKEIIGGKE